MPVTFPTVSTALIALLTPDNWCWHLHGLPPNCTQVFITDIAANLKGFSLPSSKPQDSRSKSRANDDYDDNDGDDEYE